MKEYSSLIAAAIKAIYAEAATRRSDSSLSVGERAAYVEAAQELERNLRGLVNDEPFDLFDPKHMQVTSREDAILETAELHRIEVARKQVGDETIYRYVLAFGNDHLGYIASSEEWFSPNRKGEDTPEFYEVRFQTSIHRTAAEALADALPSAIKEAAEIGEWQEQYLAERKEQGIDRQLADLLPEPALTPAPP